MGKVLAVSDELQPPDGDDSDLDMGDANEDTNDEDDDDDDDDGADSEVVADVVQDGHRPDGS
jgi:hypothetical protein